MRKPGEFELLARRRLAAALSPLRAAEQRAGRHVLQHAHSRKRLHDLEGAGEAPARRLERTLRRHVVPTK